MVLRCKSAHPLYRGADCLHRCTVRLQAAPKLFSSLISGASVHLHRICTVAPFRAICTAICTVQPSNPSIGACFGPSSSGDPASAYTSARPCFPACRNMRL